MATLIIGDWSSWCGVCGQSADPDEKRHQTVFAGPNAPTPRRCGVVWTHVARAIDSHGSEQRIREMRPDLVYLPQLVDHRELPRAGASAEARVSVTGRSHLAESANAGKPGPTTEEEDPRPGTGGPGGAPPPAEHHLVWAATVRRGIDAHHPAGDDHTGCGRPTWHGETLPWEIARDDYRMVLCRRCWPDQPTPHTQRIAPRRPL